MATQQLALAPLDSVTSSLADQVARFHGFPFKALLALLKDPNKSINSILADIGIAIGTYYSWRGALQGFAATVDAIREQKTNLRHEAAMAVFHEQTVPIAERMASRALGDTRDAQRAGERILETVGVLQPLTKATAGDGIITITDLAIRIVEQRRQVVQQQAPKALEAKADG